MSHPYKHLEETSLWKVIDKEINNLVENNDLEEITSRECIVGYLCKLINKEKIKNK